MIVIQGINKIRKYRGAVIALGVFDGVHRGHRNILQAAVSIARRVKGKSIALTFFPHPEKEPSLYSLEHRLKLIAELSIDVCIVVNFSHSFAKITADDFIAKILVEKIGVRFVCVGRNFRFGNKAGGDYRLLAAAAKKYNFKLKVFKVLKSKGLVISSTVIRKLIKSAKIKEAQELLGRRVSVLGTVINGSRLGRLLGFPTANINPHHEVIPPAGVYAAQIVFSKKKYNGVCYIGKRPTLRLENKALRVEAHLFNFHKNIYGRALEIQFIKLIRQDQKFASLKELAFQVKKDIHSCRKIIA